MVYGLMIQLSYQETQKQSHFQFMFSQNIRLPPGNGRMKFFQKLLRLKKYPQKNIGKIIKNGGKNSGAGAGLNYQPPLKILQALLKLLIYPGYMHFKDL